DSCALVFARSGDGELHAVAGGQNDRFGCPQLLQVLQRILQRSIGDGELLPDPDRCCFVADAGDVKNHCASCLRRVAWATQVMAQQASAASERIAALRPRQPALTRKKTSAR